MEEARQEKLKISNDLLDAMLVGVKTQDDLWGKEGIITQISKALLERILKAEMDFHLNNTNEGRAAGNSRNGYGRKTLKSNFGHLELSTPRDRHSTFEPQIIPKRSTKSAMLEEAILSLYAKGMTTRDIQATLQDLYHVDVSPSLISKVTDVVNEEVEQWRDRPLEAVYPVVWLDGLVVKVHHDHQVLNKTIYLALAINMEGYKELLGIWISEHEGASFWAQVLTELNNRGVKDVFVFCVDGLTGFPDAIKGVFPKSDIAVHSPLSTEQPEICELEISQGISARPEGNLPCRNIGRSGSCFTPIRRKVEREIASNICTMGTQLGKHNNNLHVSVRDKASDIHNQCDRVAQWSNKKPH